MALSKVAPRTGSFRHRLQLQSFTESRSNSGAVTRAWTTDKTIRARIHPLSSRERFTAQAAQADITHEITVHYDGAITTDHRLRDPDSGRVFNIEAPPINVEELNRELKLMCKEAVS